MSSKKNHIPQLNFQTGDSTFLVNNLETNQVYFVNNQTTELALYKIGTAVNVHKQVL